MPNLLVRDVEPDIVDALKERAARHKRSAEAEHRDILKHALLRPAKRNLAEVLASMPNVGEDEDFTRLEGEEDRDVFN